MSGLPEKMGDQFCGGRSWDSIMWACIGVRLGDGEEGCNAFGRGCSWPGVEFAPKPNVSKSHIEIPHSRSLWFRHWAPS